MRSTNHSLLKIIITVPNAVGHTASTTTPQMTNTVPIAETPESTFGTVLWCSGTGTLSLLSQTRSPSTPFAAQVSIDLGSGKSRGFSHVHRRAAAIGKSDHHSNQVRLQNARMSNGKTVLRVQTLHGLAWRFHVLSSIRKADAILRSNVMIVQRLVWETADVGGIADWLSPAKVRCCTGRMGSGAVGLFATNHAARRLTFLYTFPY